MKFTSEDLMKAMGLKVGDRVRINTKELEKYYFLVDDEDGLMLVYEDYEYPIVYLIDKEIEILPAPKRVGDLKCGENSCSICPLKAVECRNVITSTKSTLYYILDKYFKEYKDQEIYDILKARLDKEME